MTCINNKIRSVQRGFTLAETLAALTIGSIVLIIVLAIYNRAQTGATDVLDKLQSNRLPREVFQRIAEDLDQIIGSGQDVKINIQNKFIDGLSAAKLEIVRNINNAKNEPQILEKIVWQSNIDPGTGLLTLYRSHSGINLEDKLLDEQKEPWQRELFVPICTGLGFFRIEIPRGENILYSWSEERLPPAVSITLSFAQPYKTIDGTFDVPEEDKFVRTIAVDRTRKLAFVIPLPTDANQRASADSDSNSLPTDEEFEEPNDE